MKRILVNGRLTAPDLTCPACRSVLDGDGVAPGDPVVCPSCQTQFAAAFGPADRAPSRVAPAPANVPANGSDLRPILARIESNTAQSAALLREVRNWIAALILIGAFLAPCCCHPEWLFWPGSLEHVNAKHALATLFAALETVSET
jgi:hypothetical protein